jgi:hypothetical protein
MDLIHGIHVVLDSCGLHGYIKNHIPKEELMCHVEGGDLYILCNGATPNMKDKFAINLDLEAFQNHGMNYKKILPILQTHFEVSKLGYQIFLLGNVLIIV